MVDNRNDTAWHQQGDSQQHLQTAGADAVVGQRYNAVMSRPMVYIVLGCCTPHEAYISLTGAWEAGPSHAVPGIPPTLAGVQ